MSNKELITKLMWLFESQRFHDWYCDDGNFARYIRDGDISVDKVREDIANFLKITDSE